MQRAKNIVSQLRQSDRPVTEQDVINTIREYLQTLVLKYIYQSKYGNALSFMGGTALRMCYHIKRYSEDLDFALDDKSVPYNFDDLMSCVQKELQYSGFFVDHNTKADKTVQKAFLRFAKLAEIFDLKTFGKDQKLHIKVEVDINPVPITKNNRESFFVNRFQEIFPILKHNISTLFAGKILAILHRPYTRGRDFYDLIWYLSQKTALNLTYLNQGSPGQKYKNKAEVFNAIGEKVKKISPAVLLKDVGRFLEDPKEASWIEEYEKIYRQLVV
jgi:predicted nucleotidyltransferase component of viral defense system